MTLEEIREALTEEGWESDLVEEICAALTAWRRGEKDLKGTTDPAARTVQPRERPTNGLGKRLSDGGLLGGYAGLRGFDMGKVPFRSRSP